MMLAGLAHSIDATLLTSDRDFEALPEVRTENWLDRSAEYISANGLRPTGRGAEIEIELLFGCVADEHPVVDEAVAVVIAQVVEHDPAGCPNACWHLEQLDQFLRGQPAGEGLG
jgi:hypothetical protein